jgi:CelD/BcsL family acetyltransferase involved in cellulose biosynthesis
MRQVIDIDRVQEIDYLTGDDAYKNQWMSHRRERRGLIAFNPRTVGGLAALVRESSARRVKHLLRPRAGAASVVQTPIHSA